MNVSPNDFRFDIKPNRSDWKFFRKHRIAGKDYIGVHGDEPYALSLGNYSSRRAAVRLTSDGTDIISGKPANLNYGAGLWIVEPNATCELEAWPESNSSGGRFVFAQAGRTVAANTHGDVSHLGILGAAVFVETAEPRPRVDYSVLRSLGSEREVHTMGLDNPTRGVRGSSAGPGTGVGSRVEQRIEKARGLEVPRLLCVKQVYYVWWDDLQEMLRQAEPPKLEYVPGFPSAERETFHGIDLRGVPRVETDDLRFTSG